MTSSSKKKALEKSANKAKEVEREYHVGGRPHEDLLVGPDRGCRAKPDTGAG